MPEDELVRIRARGAPNRCPFCHDDVDHERDPWVACEACLARHHVACWGEGKGCADCGGTRFLASPHAPRADAELPELTVTLSIRAERPATPTVSAPVLVLPGRDESFALVVENATRAPQRIELRQLPPWLRVEGANVAEAPPDGVARFRLVVDAAGLPPQAQALREPPTRRAFVVGEPIVDVRFIVSADDVAEVVEVVAWREPTRRYLVSLGLLAGIWPWPPGVLVAVVWSISVLARNVLAPGPGPDDVAGAFERRLREANVRAVRTILPLALAVSATLIGLVVLASRSG